jgi:hypothetical protein
MVGKWLMWVGGHGNQRPAVVTSARPERCVRISAGEKQESRMTVRIAGIGDCLPDLEADVPAGKVVQSE